MQNYILTMTWIFWFSSSLSRFFFFFFHFFELWYIHSCSGICPQLVSFILVLAKFLFIKCGTNSVRSVRILSLSNIHIHTFANMDHIAQSFSFNTTQIYWNWNILSSHFYCHPSNKHTHSTSHLVFSTPE